MPVCYKALQPIDIIESPIQLNQCACVLPPHTPGKDILKQIKENTRAMAGELAVVGLMNVQYAIKDGKLFVLEVA